VVPAAGVGSSCPCSAAARDNRFRRRILCSPHLLGDCLVLFFPFLAAFVHRFISPVGFYVWVCVLFQEALQILCPSSRFNLQFFVSGKLRLVWLFVEATFVSWGA
jgi:hypothetical protein